MSSTTTPIPTSTTTPIAGVSIVGGSTGLGSFELDRKDHENVSDAVASHLESGTALLPTSPLQSEDEEDQFNENDMKSDIDHSHVPGFNRDEGGDNKTKKQEYPSSVSQPLMVTQQNDNYNHNDQIPRLVLRNLPFYQSRNRLQIENYVAPKTRGTSVAISSYEVFRLLKSDWFHVSLRLPMYVSLTLLLVIWTVMILIWGLIYLGVDNINPDVSCGLGAAGMPIKFYGAFAFSLETCTTVGYGLPSSVNAFFENCPELQVAIYFQMVWSMIFNAFLVAFFYAQSAQCDARGNQVVLSNQAIVSYVDCDGADTELNKQIRFQVRVYDIDSRTAIIESHVRIYAVMKDRPVPRQLRVLLPDDELNGMLILSIPSVIHHHIDLYSLLHPPPPLQHHGVDGNDPTINMLPMPYMTLSNGLPALRQADSLSGNRDEIICPICGEAYGSVERWMYHVNNFAQQENVGKYPVEGTHRSIAKPAIFDYASQCLKPTMDITSIQEYFYNNVSEIIVVVEGIEPTSSGTFSSIQSYRYEDIVFDENASFRPCLITSDDDTKARNKKNQNMLMVDLDRFHGVDYQDPCTGERLPYENKRNLKH